MGSFVNILVVSLLILQTMKIFSEIVAKKVKNVLGGERIPDVEVYNLEGSLFKWANESRPMVDHKDRPTSCVHPYNVVWGKLLHSHLRKKQPDP